MDLHYRNATSPSSTLSLKDVFSAIEVRILVFILSLASVRR